MNQFELHMILKKLDFDAQLEYLEKLGMTQEQAIDYLNYINASRTHSN